ncbi:hypothetical protein PPL_06977 [Heterostelium album PN500]|uniref:non-specific serine/threonine protein kinase n=1 Tax=Heterostelium pallidum (strain ATCC 26659 / Pp 5 / PN500) TaxID=670386 RepID=D3BE24_HETP5|nr:hypothetical protein PPL_06977 [Heterostelium album PN500]EFA80155.1 hypothetical protein PPL_06977 [Heterostelium album PN500]|eukprot:XP_020432275.1 hypothetical protein PPL_06977 [Heterostelium album PN500]
MHCSSVFLFTPDCTVKNSLDVDHHQQQQHECTNQLHLYIVLANNNNNNNSNLNNNIIINSISTTTTQPKTTKLCTDVKTNNNNQNCRNIDFNDDNSNNNNNNVETYKQSDNVFNDFKNKKRLVYNDRLLRLYQMVQQQHLELEYMHGRSMLSANTNSDSSSSSGSIEVPGGGNNYIPPLQSIFFTLNFSGGQQMCSSCVDPSEHWLQNYSCSNDVTNWNEGKIQFQDPLPSSDVLVLRKAILQVFGHFISSGPALVILLDDEIFGLFTPPVKNTSDCLNCVTSSDPYIMTYTNGLTTYNYGSTNYFQFQSTNNETITCLSSISVTFFYGPTSFRVNSISPSMGPAGGGTLVYVSGSGFIKTGSPVCRFGNLTSQATYINDTMVSCSSPVVPQTIKGFYNVTLQVSFDSGTTFSYPNLAANFSFYYFPSQPLSNNKFDRVILIAIGTGIASVFLTGVVVYFAVQRWQKRRGYQQIGDGNINGENAQQPFIFNTADYKTLFEIKPIEMSEIVIQNRIGRGSCAEVFTGTWRGITVAIKKAKLLSDDDEEFLTELAQEAAIMSQLRHPNVCQFLGTCNNPPEVLIVMEWMSRGSLYRILHDQSVMLDWPRMKSIALDIAKGMNYLHCCDPIIIHRDLKSHNLLVDEHFRVKISDFGLSTRFKQHLDKKTTMTPVGTPCWTAPEVLRNDPYTEKADIFSYAIVLWELVTREDPYQGMPTFQIVISVGQHKLRPIVPPHVSAPFTRLITECWSEDPSQRPSFQEIVKRLEAISSALQLNLLLLLLLLLLVDQI